MPSTLQRRATIAANQARRIDLAGDRSGLLTARERIGSAANGTLWLCDCDCGGEITVVSGSFIRRATKSCGCLSRSGEKYQPKRGQYAGKLFRTVDSAAREYPDLVGVTIQRAREKAHRDLLDQAGNRRKIITATLKHHPVQKNIEVTYYLDDDLKAMDAAKKARAESESAAEPWQDADGMRWRTVYQMKDIYGRSHDTYRVWAKTPSKIRPGQMALRSRPVPNPNRSGTIPGYREGDWQDIVSGKEGQAGTGHGLNAAGMRDKKVRDAMAALPKIIKQRMRRRDVLARARADYRLGARFVLAAFDRLHGITEERPQAARPWLQEVTWRLPADAYDWNEAEPPRGKKRGPERPAADEPDPVERLERATLTVGLRLEDRILQIPRSTAALLREEGLATDAPTHALDDEDLSILAVLHRRTGRRLTAQQIEGLSTPRVSERTIRDRLPALLGAGLVARRGERGGWSITPGGARALESSAD